MAADSDDENGLDEDSEGADELDDEDDELMEEEDDKGLFDNHAEVSSDEEELGNMLKKKTKAAQAEVKPPQKGQNQGKPNQGKPQNQGGQGKPQHQGGQQKNPNKGENNKGGNKHFEGGNKKQEILNKANK